MFAFIIDRMIMSLFFIFAALFLQTTPHMLKKRSINAAEDWMLHKIIANLYSSGKWRSYFLQNSQLFIFMLYLFSIKISRSFSISDLNLSSLMRSDVFITWSSFSSSSANKSLSNEDASVSVELRVRCL